MTRIVVFSLSALGDLLMTLPLMGALRQRYARAEISLVCERPAVRELAEQLEVAERVVLLPAGARRSPFALMQSLQRVKQLKAEMVFQTFTSHGTFSNLLAGATQAERRIGFEAGRFRERLTHRIPIPTGMHQITLNLNLLRRLGEGDVAEPSERFLPYLETKSATYPSGTATAKFGTYLVCAVGSDPKLRFKRWPLSHWAALTTQLTQEGLTCVYVGHALERDEIAQIERQTSGKIVNLAGETSFADLAAVLHESRGVVGTDGMLLHLAAAMRKPCVGLFGPTHPDFCGPFGQRGNALTLHLPCSPCYGPANIGKEIACTTYECLQFLSPSWVLQEVKRVLQANANL